MIGSRLGSYEVTAKVGEGGMGEVYQATDTQLDRQVALKVLPEAFTQDKERLARFEREAKLLAQLNHSNIAQIYGLEASGETRALVMELVEGPTLAERLEAGPLPLEESLSIARQIAEALEEAHEKGIIHRDLKPQNIKASIEGTVKVLDFGLAKALDPTVDSSAAAAELSESPTLTMGATVQGVILGTAAYMSPEQAKGMAVDKRADIWAFGVVLYEMLTGRRLFAGDTLPEILAEVLKTEIDFAQLPEATPTSIRRLLRRCLQRSRRNRLHDIADARIVIAEVEGGQVESEELQPSPASVARGVEASAWRRLAPWLVGTFAGLLLGAFVTSRINAPLPVSGDGLTTIRTLVSAGRSDDPSMSPDGKTLAFHSFRNGEERVWIKDLNSGSESALGPNPSWGPTFSPDGTSVLFETTDGGRNDLYRVSLATREQRLVARDAMEGAWSPDGRSVVFLRPKVDDEVSSQLLTIELGSGQESIEIQGGRLEAPKWSPDGKRIAVVVREGQAGIGDRIGLLEIGSGHLDELEIRLGRLEEMKVRGITWLSRERLALLLQDEGGYLGSSGRVALFDLTTHQTESVLPLHLVGQGIVSAGKGSLIVALESQEQSLFELKRDAKGGWGDVAQLTEGPFSDRQPTYTPDGRWLLFSSNRSGNLDIWRLARETGELQRLTDHEAEDWDPAVSPDGRQLIFSSNRTGRFQVWVADADGTSPRQVTDLENAQNPTMTHDGEWIAFVLQDAGSEKNGIWKIRTDGTDATQVAKGTLFLSEVSPDGRFVAYQSPRVIGAGLNIARLDDNYLLPIELAGSLRFRWSIERGKTQIYGIVDSGEDVSVRRYSIDLESERLGSGEVIVEESVERAPESIGVMMDGSALAFSRTATVRTQIIRIDGLSELETP
jgi:serine/threonine protein kinase